MSAGGSKALIDRPNQPTASNSSQRHRGTEGKERIDAENAEVSQRALRRPFWREAPVNRRGVIFARCARVEFPSRPLRILSGLRVEAFPLCSLVVRPRSQVGAKTMPPKQAMA
jgi:hypothetical protein